MGKLKIRPASDRVLIKITRKQQEDITSKMIKRDDGTTVRLFIEPGYDPGYDRRFMQNVSIGEVIAVGKKITKVEEGDIAVLDYLVRNDIDVFVGYFNDRDLIVSVKGETSIHKEDSLPSQTGRMAWIKGDYDTISPLMGVVRGDKVIAFDPYVFLVAKRPVILTVLPNNQVIETKETISTRTVLSAPEESGVEEGDEVTFKSDDMFPRYVNEKELSVIFKDDILLVK
jgi:co-chaperonin GroES (HSP10)